MTRAKSHRRRRIARDRESNIHYTPTGIPIRVTGGGTTGTRLNARQKRRLLRTAQRAWAQATITWKRDVAFPAEVWLG